ncbi:MAG: hypothetical protein IKF51_00655, partial [Solobacterium sp.]|nr:hypothetical protein [Solobacterium sp.]
MKCPECGGTLYYSIEQRKLVCEHCGQTFSPDQYRNNNAAMDEDWGGAHTYHCRSCGAELLAMNDEALVYCPYCGSEALLEGELQGMNRPKQLIPFSISKEACKRLYSREVKNKLYLPKEFKDPEFIERFRPFYIPYWMYRVKFRDEPFDAIGYKDYTSLGYDYHEEYEVRAEIKEKGLYGVPYDASRNFDDTIAENIAPFLKKELKPFRPGYLAGMYADRPNVDPEVYREDVLERAAVSAVEDIKNGLGGIVLKLPKGKKLQKFLDSRYEGAEAVFLPVWFLTWRRGDRVAYAVVNGQTGKIHIDLPTDLRSFMLRTVIAAGLLFALL